MIRELKLTLAALLLFSLPVLPQGKQKPFELNGYITSMQSAMFDSLSKEVIYENLIHNRLNFKVYLGKHLTFSTEIRNRLLTGDMVRSMGPAYSEMTATDDGLIDMSWNLVSENSFFLNTSVDRLWIDFTYDKFQARIGRQRINWGQTFVWNPNDILNAYSFFDVDYVERPGSDAIRLQYYPSFSSALELAIKVDSEQDVTAAGLGRFNLWGYDFQFLAGWSNSSDIVAGAGWSGNLGSFSFRGEGTWFHPARSFADTSGTVILTAGLDRVFDDNSMAQVQLMYCNDPLRIGNFMGLYSGDLTARDLAFSEFTAFGQYTWAATPLLNIGASAMWFPDLKGWFAGPSVDYSLAENLDFSFIMQHFRGTLSEVKTRLNLVYLRVKLSF
ncbi:MAG: hypothetical protein JXR66_06925 [Bacteroidales bacterium]|nr:hypothetical protein [Bacteroidales bacterium]MBN2633267.1 hypothetical protein [Bacteroidales bacterium]